MFNPKDGYHAGQFCYNRDWQGSGFAESFVREIATAFWQTDCGQINLPPDQWLNDFVRGFIAAEETPETPIKKLADDILRQSGINYSPDAMPELMQYYRAMQTELGLPTEAQLREANNPYADQFTAFKQELGQLYNARDTLTYNQTLSETEQTRLNELNRQIDLILEQARSQGYLL
jgi:hypothetical protein